MFGGFCNTLLAAGYRAYLARQAHFTKHDQLFGQSPVLQTGNHRQQHGKVGAGFQHFDTAHHVKKYILIAGKQSAVTVKNG